MRNNFITHPQGAVDRLIVFLLVFFVLHSIAKLFSPSAFEYTYKFLSFSPSGLSNFYVWTPLTYCFLHDGVFHLIMNLLGLYFIGKAVEVDVGVINFWYLSIIGSLSGCFIWFLFNTDGLFLVGSSSIVMSCLSYYCLKNPSSSITLLLFFILPCRIQPKWLLCGILLIESYGFIFNELNGTTEIAHSAHLGGLCGGAIFFLYLRSGRVFPIFTLNSPGLRYKKNKSRSVKIDKSNFKINFSDTNDLQFEVDRILDKINDSGFGSLTKKEKSTLEKAKGLL
jgi:membrane associated rhomboid family serine protease